MNFRKSLRSVLPAALGFILFALIPINSFGVAFSGAEEDLAASIGQPPDLKIILDSTELEKARSISSHANDPLSHESIAELWSPTKEDLPQDTSPEIVHKRLTEIIENSKLDIDIRSNAAILLMFLDSNAGQKSILKMLSNSGPRDQGSILRNVFFLEDGAIQFTDTSLIEKILSLITQPEVGEHAIQTAGNLELPGTRTALKDAIPELESDEKAEALYWLTRLEPTIESLDMCTTTLVQLEQSDRMRCLSAISNLLDRSEETVAQEAAEFLATELLTLLQSATVNRYSFPQSECEETLAAGTGPQTLKLAKAIREKSSDNYLKRAAFQTLRRSEGHAGIEKIFKGLSSDEDFYAALFSIEKLYANTGHQKATQSLWKASERRDKPSELRDIVKTLLAVGGVEATKRARSIVDRLPQHMSSALLMLFDPRTPEEYIGQLVELGLIEDGDSDQLISAAIKTFKNFNGDDETPIISPFDLLQESGVFVAFDTETGFLPVGHDKLIKQFAAASSGEFQPEACYEKMHRKHSDDWDGPYTVQFISNEKLFRFPAENLGDWYDVGPVVNACNLALADSGSKKRYIQLEPDGQVAVFACIDPKHIKTLSDDFYIVFATEVDTAMNLGKEYEERVIKELEAQTL